MLGQGLSNFRLCWQIMCDTVNFLRKCFCRGDCGNNYGWLHIVKKIVYMYSRMEKRLFLLPLS